MASLVGGCLLARTRLLMSEVIDAAGHRCEVVDFQASRDDELAGARGWREFGRSPETGGPLTLKV